MSRVPDQPGRHADLASAEIDVAAVRVRALERHFDGPQFEELRESLRSVSVWLASLQAVDRPATPNARLRLAGESRTEIGSGTRERWLNANRGPSW